MSSKFQYAPGMPGYGTKGINGIDGSTGLSMYFTNLNGVEDKTVIKNKITGNISLWASSLIPNNRSYQSGDTFVDKQGRVYEIRLNLSDKFVSTGTSLSVSDIFALYDDVTNDVGFARYSNQFIGTHNIIDSVFSDTINEYTAYPVNIYGLKPVNFARVEYSDISPEFKNFNPFSVFTSGVNSDNAIALVRDKNTNQFRLGNLDASLKSRNVDLVFDVHELTVSKDASNYFTANTPEGTILTNYELKVKNLVDPVFKRDASSALTFTVVNSTDISIYWNLMNMAGTTDMATITADLYVYQDTTTSPIYYNFTNMVGNSSTMSMVFREIPTSGVIGITGLLSSNTYHTYIDVYQNGWKRQTSRLKIYPGVTPFVDISLGS